MAGKIEIANITKVRDGLWFISYTHECDCGCTKTRHNFNVSQKVKPTENSAKIKANEHYSQQ